MNISGDRITAHKLKLKIEETLTNKSALDVISIDLKGKSDIADFMIIASGTSTTHVKALAEHAEKTLKEMGEAALSVDGKSECKWILIDSPYVIIHIFHPETRAIYGLEKMWEPDFNEAKIEAMEPAL